MYYDKDFFDWYNNIYLKAKDEQIIKKSTELKARRKKISALEKKLAEKQREIDELKELDKFYSMQILARKLDAYKKSSRLTYREIAERVGTTISVIRLHLEGSIKTRSRYTKAIENYLETHS